MSTSSKNENALVDGEYVDVNPEVLEASMVNGTRNSRRKSLTELKRLSQSSRNSERHSGKMEDIDRQELREMLELKHYHEYMRELMTIWKHTLIKKQVQINHEILECVNQNESKVDVSSNELDNTKEEYGKQILFWLSSCLSRINEPHHLLREIEKLKQAGLNEKQLDKILKQILNHLSDHKLFDFKIKEMFDEICFQLLILFNPPKCEKCPTQLVVVVPKDVKPSNTQNPFHGFVLGKQTRDDPIPVCESCQQRLILEDVYFQCPQCGPNEIIRVIRGGRLKTIVKKPQGGSTICVECVTRMYLKQCEKKQKHAESNHHHSSQHIST